MAWSRTSAHQRGYGAAWRALRLEILQRDRGLCCCPRCLGGKLRLRPAHEVDHIVPKARGGSDDPDNLRSVNHECHKRITAEAQGRKLRPRVGPDGWPIPDMPRA